jgi:Tfp pilus assembly pilus retraction ATPase PilT
MLNTTAVRNNIKKREIPQLANIIETGANYGMISMQKYAENLLAQGKVDEATIQFIMAENIT